MGSTIYTEVFVLALVLISNVLGNNFVGYIPRTATEIAARLQVPAPKLLLQVRKFRQQMSLKYRVRAPSVFRHPLSLRAARLLKPSPVRRGLQPSQTGTVKQVGCLIETFHRVIEGNLDKMELPLAASDAGGL